jgi:hypothetical protein
MTEKADKIAATIALVSSLNLMTRGKHAVPHAGSGFRQGASHV